MRRILAGWLAMAAIALVPLAQAEGIKLLKEVHLFAGEYWTPVSLSHMPDQSLLLAVDFVRRGKVIKLDADSNPIWTHEIEQTVRKAAAQGGTVAAAVPGADGKALVCATEHPENNNIKHDSKGRFILLDNAGHRLRDFQVDANSTPGFRLHKLDKCGRWGEGYFALGHGVTVHPDPSEPSAKELRYHAWLLHLTKDGELQWQRTIELPIVYDEFSTPREMPGNALLLVTAGRQGLIGLTEVTLVSATGNILKRKLLAAQQRLVQSPQADGAIVFGDNGMMVTLNGALDVVSEDRAPNKLAWYKRVYLDGQGRFTAFGFSIVPNGWQRMPVIARNSPGSNDTALWFLPSRIQTALSAGPAIPLHQANEFAFAFQPGGSPPSWIPPNESKGVVVSRFRIE